MEFHMINIIYAALPMRAQTEKTTFSRKDNCSLTKRTRRWTYSALRYFLCQKQSLLDFQILTYCYDNNYYSQIPYLLLLYQVSSQNTTFSCYWTSDARYLFLWLEQQLRFQLNPSTQEYIDRKDDILCHVCNIGTSMRRSSRSAFGRSTGNDVSGHYKRPYWHERAAFQSVCVRAVDWQWR